MWAFSVGVDRQVRKHKDRFEELFPNMDSYIRSITSNLIEYSKGWSAGRSYIIPEKIALIKEERQQAAWIDEVSAFVLQPTSPLTESEDLINA